MADKLTEKPKLGKGGFAIKEWLEQAYLPFKARHDGPKIACKHFDGKVIQRPMNGVGILFEQCEFMREGTSDNFGFGGSNCPTGIPVDFVDLESCIVPVFCDERKGILKECKGKCFILSMCQLDTSPIMISMMNDTFAHFIAQQKGGVSHDETHIANGICAASSATCYALSCEITLAGKEPNEKKIHFLVEALHALALTAHSAAKYSKKCEKIFRLMPYMARTADTFQSVLMAFIFDEIPCESIRVKLVGLSIFRHFNNTNRNSDFTRETPVGLVGLLLIAPMLSGMLSSDMETSEMINDIVRSINGAIDNIIKRFKSVDVAEIARRTRQNINHVKNKLVLRGFAKATKVPWVSPKQIDGIYDAVLSRQKDVAKTIGIVDHISFVRDCEFLLNGDPTENFVVMTKHNGVPEKDSKQVVRENVSFIPSDVREWSGVSLQQGTYELKGTPLGNAEFKSGKTAGEHFVANFRISAGNELLKGSYQGYAATGMYYDPNTRRFTEADNHDEIEPTGTFKIVSSSEGITVSQGDTLILRIKSNGGKIYPLIAFKYCMIEVTLIEKVKPTQPTQPTTLVTPSRSWSSIVTGKTQILPPNESKIDHQKNTEKIEGVKSLSESLKEQEITVAPLRKAAPSKYGSQTARQLQYQAQIR